jgi:hypothetical protein
MLTRMDGGDGVEEGSEDEDEEEEGESFEVMAAKT